MPIQVLMPALSPTMEKGNLSKWLKKEGETIKSGDVIAEIETDKATMEVEATDEGTPGKILIPEGTNDVAVNTPIATIPADGGGSPDARKGGSPRKGTRRAAGGAGSSGGGKEKPPHGGGCASAGLEGRGRKICPRRPKGRRRARSGGSRRHRNGDHDHPR